MSNTITPTDRFSLPFTSFGALNFSDETILHEIEQYSYVEARMNSKTAQLTENGTEIVRVFARFALGASFLSAVADRFGLWGPYGGKNVSWGNFAHFVEYTSAVTSLFPSSLTVSFAWAATIAETLFGILLIAGFKIRMASILYGLLLLSFGEVLPHRPQSFGDNLEELRMRKQRP